MHIERLQVETEGFLAGLDLHFNPGLNVIIGARGTGKTSIVELIRFCTGAGSFTEEAATRGHQQAIAILDGGAATLTIRDRDSTYTITRSASGHVSTSGGPSDIACTVLAQNEIEAVGAQAAGRLHLIDRFRANREAHERSMQLIQSSLRSLTTEIASLMNDRRAIDEEISLISSVADELTEAKHQQQELLETSHATQEQQSQLKQLQEAGQLIATRESVLGQDAAQLVAFKSKLNQLISEVPRLLQPWPTRAGEDLIADQRQNLSALSELLVASAERLSQVEEALNAATRSTTLLRSSVDVQSRQVRQMLDTVQTGIGRASRRVAELEEKQGRLEALNNRLAERISRFKAVSSKRDALYNQLEIHRDDVFADRESVVEQLNKDLAPTVKVRLTRSENVEPYRAAIVAGLRGSGIHYNSLASQVAKEMSPHELVTWTENGNADALGSALGIAPSRAHAIIAALRNQGIAEIIAADIDDGATLYLLDGPDYKPSDRLSIGQRCTAVLPVLLGHHGDPLVLDQPEDHLDNAFIASTLVNSLRRRLSDDQFILTSHNANIPVLGNADRLIVMDSDGEHGFAAHQGALDESQVVQAVTRIMEGGVEAFAARSAFYEGEGVTA